MHDAIAQTTQFYVCRLPHAGRAPGGGDRRLTTSVASNATPARASAANTLVDPHQVALPAGPIDHDSASLVSELSRSTFKSPRISLLRRCSGKFCWILRDKSSASLAASVEVVAMETRDAGVVAAPGSLPSASEDAIAVDTLPSTWRIPSASLRTPTIMSSVMTSIDRPDWANTGAPDRQTRISEANAPKQIGASHIAGGGVRPTISMAATIANNPTGASAGQGLEGPGENVAVGRMQTFSMMGEGFARTRIARPLTGAESQLRNLRSFWL
jgi:hypothetical protein